MHVYSLLTLVQVSLLPWFNIIIYNQQHTLSWVNMDQTLPRFNKNPNDKNKKKNIETVYQIMMMHTSILFWRTQDLCSLLTMLGWLIYNIN